MEANVIGSKISGNNGKLVVFNTLTRSKETFVPMHDNEIKMFVCGQTVYDDAHMGHAKTYINFDVIVRWLRFLGYDVNYIQNITDVDDKIIARANERGMSSTELARYYEERLMKDMDDIGVRQNVSKYIRSTDYIDAMRDQIQLLVDRGYAYFLDGDIYYDVSKFPDYTKLSGMKVEELVKHRIEPREGKRNSYDFALWKASKPGEPSWRIDIKIEGKTMQLEGRPGWHIEDTAMTYANFGPQYDIHGGASELIFPHHTNEIAQAEGAYGVKPFVRYWLHSGVLNIRNEKMSKSLKNFVKIRDVIDKYGGEAIRFLYIQTHYRKDFNYYDALMDDAYKKLNYLYDAFSIFYNMNEAEGASSIDQKVLDAVSRFESEFSEAMNDDFNTPLALSKLVIIINSLRNFAETSERIGKDAKSKAIEAVLRYSNALGILTKESYKKSIPLEVSKLIEERDRLRKEGKYEEADAIREKLSSGYGIRLEDTEYGTIWFTSQGASR
ncbi:MAG: cysteine--tRNA ligase [Candidatus Micrarchaeia archaeon]